MYIGNSSAEAIMVDLSAPYYFVWTKYIWYTKLTQNAFSMIKELIVSIKFLKFLVWT